MKRSALAAAVLAAAWPAFARERHEFFDGARSLAMGGVYVATANDETALASNPAALGRLRDFYGTIFDPEIDIGAKAIDMYRAEAFSNPFKVDGAMPSMKASQGSYLYARAQLFPSFVARNFGIGLIARQTMAGVATSATQADVFSRNDLGLLLGYNLRLWGGRIKIGFTGKVLSRIELDEPALDTTLPLDDASLAAAGKLKEGTGIGADASLLLTAPWVWLPSIGAVVHDVGNTVFDKDLYQRLPDATTRPGMAVQDVDVGISVSPIHANNVRSQWSVEYRGLLTAKDETDKAKLIHFGTEFNFGDVFLLRAGYNQRYFTGGFELASENFQFQFTTYGEEIGDETAPLEDRRYVLKLGFRF